MNIYEWLSMSLFLGCNFVRYEMYMISKIESLVCSSVVDKLISIIKK